MFTFLGGLGACPGALLRRPSVPTSTTCFFRHGTVSMHRGLVAPVVSYTASHVATGPAHTTVVICLPRQAPPRRSRVVDPNSHIQVDISKFD
eukprot:2123278-Rhodomonas_salina.1